MGIDYADVGLNIVVMRDLQEDKDEVDDGRRYGDKECVVDIADETLKRVPQMVSNDRRRS